MIENRPTTKLNDMQDGMRDTAEKVTFHEELLCTLFTCHVICEDKHLIITRVNIKCRRCLFCDNSKQDTNAIQLKTQAVKRRFTRTITTKYSSDSFRIK